MSREFRRIERNRARLGCGLTDAEFAQLRAEIDRQGKRAERLLLAVVIGISAYCLYEPLAETLILAFEFAVKALENLA